MPSYTIDLADLSLSSPHMVISLCIGIQSHEQ